jgi:hypothetical protein
MKYFEASGEAKCLRSRTQRSKKPEVSPLRDIEDFFDPRTKSLNILTANRPKYFMDKLERKKG